MAATGNPLNNTTSYDEETLNTPTYMMGNHVIMGYLNELLVTNSATNGKVTVLTGAAITYFRAYTNDASLDLSITSATNNRIDLVVLRWVAAARTIRATVITGTAAANPVAPAFVAEVDLPLAWIWVPAGFNPAANTIAAADVHDMRVFSRTGAYTTPGYYTFPDASLENLMPNSEFIAYSGYAAGNIAPEGWRLTAAPPTDITRTALLSNGVRGHSIQITGDAGQGMQTQVKTAQGANYTLKGTLFITSGSVRVSLDGVNTDFKQTGRNVEFIIRSGVKYATTERTISITANSAGTVFKVGQLILAQGCVPGHFRPKHETIFLDYPLTDAAWTATAKSDSNTAIDMAASFGPMLLTSSPIRGLIVQIEANDSGSAAAVCGVWINSMVSGQVLSGVYLTNQDNDVKRSVTAFVPFIEGIGYTFYVLVEATGPGTLDATIQVLGIIT